MKIGGGELSADIEAVRALRAIVGPDIRLMVDYNQSFDPPEACARLARFRDFDLHWVEEPVRADDLAGHARVRAKAGVNVQTGENWWFPADCAKAIAAGASDFVMLDVMKIGGVSGWIRAAALAEVANLPVSSHAFIEASAHALAATPNAHWIQYLDKAAPILKEPLQVVDGTITPKGPGLGIPGTRTRLRAMRLEGERTTLRASDAGRGTGPASRKPAPCDPGRRCLGHEFRHHPIGLDRMPPLLFASLRFLFALVPAVFFLERPPVPWRNLAAYGLLGGVGQFGLLYLAITVISHPDWRPSSSRCRSFSQSAWLCR